VGIWGQGNSVRHPVITRTQRAVKKDEQTQVIAGGPSNLWSALKSNMGRGREKTKKRGSGEKKEGKQPAFTGN